AMSAAIVLNCGWVLVVSGTLPAAALVHETGTIIGLLAEQVGPIVNGVGVVFVLLGMGMGCVHVSWAVMNQMREWLGAERRGGFFLRAAPVVAIFGLGEWLLSVDAPFAGPLGVVGVLAF